MRSGVYDRGEDWEVRSRVHGRGKNEEVRSGVYGRGKDWEVRSGVYSRGKVRAEAVSPSQVLDGRYLSKRCFLLVN